MSDYDLRPCPFCNAAIATERDTDGTWRLVHPSNRCLLDRSLWRAVYWYDRESLVEKWNNRPTEERLRASIRYVNNDLWRERERNWVLKATKEVQNSRRWWQFWRKEDKNA